LPKGVDTLKQPPAVDEECKHTKFHDVNDQVQVLRQWWDSIETIKNPIPHELVAKMLKQIGLCHDLTSGLHAIQHKMDELKLHDKVGVEFDDFLAMFLRGIVKDLVEGIFREVTKDQTEVQAGPSETVIAQVGTGDVGLTPNQKMKNKDMQKEKTLVLKLNEFKRNKLFDLLEKTNTADDQNMPVNRPVLENLYNKRQKEAGKKVTRVSYDAFYKNNVVNNFIGNFKASDIDQFARNCVFVNDGSSKYKAEDVRASKSLHSSTLGIISPITKQQQYLIYDKEPIKTEMNFKDNSVPFMYKRWTFEQSAP
jgi:hypothetical protein